jgi:S1-C subfamily serine protease
LKFSVNPALRELPKRQLRVIFTLEREKEVYLSKPSIIGTAIFAVVMFCPALSCTTAQKNTTHLIDLVRPAVVQVLVHITDGAPTISLPVSVQSCFDASKINCVVGTGFFVNDTGDVVTACHVADGVQQIVQLLGTTGIHARATIGINMPNVETKNLTLSSGTVGFPATLIATDPEHDIAVFRPATNPFTNMPKTFAGPGASGFPQTKAAFVHLAVGRPRDGEEVFACGFPFGEPGLVTTSGAIASAWKTELLTTAKAAGMTIPVEIYWVDLRVNPGNSGGPVFLMGERSVVAMVVELKGSLGFAVPAKYIVEFLKTHDIRFTSMQIIYGAQVILAKPALQVTQSSRTL